ncbi:wax ester/triacylglycerol synthase domain-containing protein [Mycolicibacterium houstonense]|uniref:wax ester/triacylglycerol synthase domain-containing protein n=1 Tax=Mycolicibacterium houstonense TaxID=146021 RepID=UPI00082987D4|nr:wax ester/triacylglycerol synthase domain-containing protein [Mycolicibacterium houstonense]
MPRSLSLPNRPKPAAALPDNRLSLWDEAAVRTMRATGRVQVMQCSWVYDHPVDFDGIRRFHENFGGGLFGRRIERSPLPFGRYRWVSAVGPQAPLDVAEPRTRAEIGDWIDERAQLPIDPERGPGWHMGVLPVTDGSTAVTVVVSHCLGDGVGGVMVIADAIAGRRPDLGYPIPNSRSRLRAIAADLRATLSDASEVAGAIGVGIGLLRRRESDVAETTTPKPARVVPNGAEQIVLPAISVFVDLADWNARAEAIGGNSYSMLAGFAARLGERMGRCAAEGDVTLLIAVNDRTDGDTRANAMLLATAQIDPMSVTADQSAARGAIRQAFKTLREVPDETLQLLPLTPLVPKGVLKQVADGFLGNDDLPVSCSNLGDLTTDVTRLDGTEAEYIVFRGVDQGTTRQELEDNDGQLVLVSARVGGKVSIGITAYQAGEQNSKARLAELAAKTLAEFDLTGEIDWNS